MPSCQSTVRDRETPEHLASKNALTSVGRLSAEELAGRIVLLRIDGAVEAGAPEVLWDDTLERCMPTLDLLTAARARVALLCHADAGDSGCSLSEAQRALGRRLAFLLRRRVEAVDDCRGTDAAKAVTGLREGDVLLLGNLAREPAEEENQPEFAGFLADLCDLYCNEAFGLAHQVRASTVGVAGKACQSVAGLEFDWTASMLAGAFDRPLRPFVAVFGGSLSTGRLLLLESIATRADAVLVGGELCVPFLKAQGRPAGAVAVPDEAVEIAAHILDDFRESKQELLLPQDFILVEAGDLKCASSEKHRFSDAGTRGGSVASWAGSQIASCQIAGDIGLSTRWAWSEKLGPARTMLWHGPLGVCELPPLCAGTLFFAEQVASRTWPSMHRTVVCGESLVRALRGSRLSGARIQQLSPAGTAILHYAARRPLPALEALCQPRAHGHRRRPSVVVALAGADEDAALARFAATWFADGARIHCVYAEPGPDEDRYPDLYVAMTEAERLAERLRAERIFARADAALASQGTAASTQALIHGNPSVKLIQRARDLAADVIVMGGGAAARRRYSRDKVIAGAPCHVLVVPS
jgi:phosphoglycerate kinase